MRPARQLVHAIRDLFRSKRFGDRAHRLGINGVHRVAPGAAVVAASKAHKMRWDASFGTFPLNRGPEDLDDREGLLAGTRARCERGGRRHAASLYSMYFAGSSRPFSANPRSRSEHA